MGMRMSVGPSCARIEPSTNSTMEWTVDWGWMTTWILSRPVPKSHLASITSKPLFMRVAESMVMRWPIFQLGWFRACFGVIFAKWERGVLRKGPPLAVRIRRLLLSTRRRRDIGGWRCVRSPLGVTRFCGGGLRPLLLLRRLPGLLYWRVLCVCQLRWLCRWLGGLLLPLLLRRPFLLVRGWLLVPCLPGRTGFLGLQRWFFVWILRLGTILRRRLLWLR